MQLLIAFTCALICLSAVVADPPTSEFMTHMKEAMGKCMEESGANMDIIKKVKQGEGLDDEKLHCFSACMMKAAGIMDEAGVAHPEVAIEKIPDDIPREDAISMIELCSNKKGDTPCATAGLIMECLHANKADQLFHVSHE